MQVNQLPLDTFSAACDGRTSGGHRFAQVGLQTSRSHLNFRGTMGSEEPLGLSLTAMQLTGDRAKQPRLADKW